STQVGLKSNTGGGRTKAPNTPKLNQKDSIKLQTFDFGVHLRSIAGDPPAGMPNPHAHHILFKKGLGQKQQDLVIEGQALLKKYEIDPIFGSENLIWAPNRIKGQHDINALQQVVDTLKMTDEMFGTRDEMVNALKQLGKTAAERR
ncbi:MAG: AHH domain-containing protein, partial [Candidatus Thiodiazotropha sp.]